MHQPLVPWQAVSGSFLACAGWAMRSSVLAMPPLPQRRPSRLPSALVPQSRRAQSWTSGLWCAQDSPRGHAATVASCWRRWKRPSKTIGVVVIIVFAFLHMCSKGPLLFVSRVLGGGRQISEDARLAAISLGSLSLLVLFLLGLQQRQQTQARVGGASKPSSWEGANVKLLALCFAVGWAVRFLAPIPKGVSAKAWSMLSIFVAMICGVVTSPLPPAGVTLVAMTAAVGTGTISFAEGMQAFTDETVWLVLMAFFIAEGFQKTGLGNRIALSVIRTVGHTTLGLAYGLNATELAVAVAMPSSAARATAVFLPITTAVCRASGSDPAEGTRMRCGAFLIESVYQSTAVSSCLFQTAAASNYFLLKLAADVGVHVPSPFYTWFLAALAPALVCFILVPLVALRLLPPEASKTPDAPLLAAERLEAMGPVSDSEKVFGGIMVAMVILWATTSSTGLPPVVTGVGGLATLMLTGVLTWDDCARNQKAWGMFVSFACLVGLAANLNALGIVKWIADTMTALISAAGLGPTPSFLVIVLSYWLIHYIFASQAAHISALYQPFLLMLVHTGTPGVPAALALAYVSNLFMTLTPYASAQSPVILGSQYVTVGEWYKAGFLYFCLYAVVWIGVGSVWWRVIGLI